jgi:hypothetical protein
MKAFFETSAALLVFLFFVLPVAAVLMLIDVVVTVLTVVGIFLALTSPIWLGYLAWTSL